MAANFKDGTVNHQAFRDISLKNLVLHIGLPKTGTSYVQRILATNPAKLCSHGILYPAIERWQDAHHPICDHLILHEDGLIPPPTGSLDDFIAYCYLPKFRNLDKIIISSEGLCRGHSLKSREIQSLKKHFHITVIACFRHPLHWANSLVNEFAKSQLFHGENYIEKAISIINLCINYRNLLSIWQDMIDLDNIHPLILNEGDNFSARFLSHFKLSVNEFTHIGCENKNRSLGLGALQLINWLAAQNFEMDYNRKVALMGRIGRFQERQGSPNLLQPDLESRIRAISPEICGSLREIVRFGQEFSDPPPLSSYHSERLLDAPDLSEIAGKVLFDDKRSLDALLLQIEQRS